MQCRQRKKKQAWVTKDILDPHYLKERIENRLKAISNQFPSSKQLTATTGMG